MRLGFSVAVTMDLEILLVDEVLAVGDASFRTEMFDRVYEFRQRGKMLRCVSLSGDDSGARDRPIRLHHGEVVTTRGGCGSDRSICRASDHCGVVIYFLPGRNNFSSGELSATSVRQILLW